MIRFYTPTFLKSYTYILIAGILLLCTTQCKYVKSKQAASPEADLIEIPKKADGSIDYSKLPVIAFTQTKYDFGQIQRNVKVRHAFEFTNEGSVPLIVSNVTTGCGCTVPSWPRHPIAPGAKDSIVVVYNSEGVTGAFNKGISVTSNTYPNESILAIKGFVGQKRI